jgi:hypothetical protein
MMDYERSAKDQTSVRNSVEPGQNRLGRQSLPTALTVNGSGDVTPRLEVPSKLSKKTNSSPPKLVFKFATQELNLNDAETDEFKQ